MSKKHFHQGHRQRLKQRIQAVGISNIPEHELLELLLTYAIPYRDCNALSHMLIAKYGGIARVMNQTVTELVSNEGISEHTAILLSSMPEIFARYRQNNEMPITRIVTTKDMIEYFRANYTLVDHEIFYVIVLNVKMKVIKVFTFEGKNAISISFTSRQAFERILSVKPHSIFFAHTHPHGEAYPSKEDTMSTMRLVRMCKLFNIEVKDHIIFNHNDYYSYEEKGMLKHMKYCTKVELSRMGETEQALHRIVENKVIENPCEYYAARDGEIY